MPNTYVLVHGAWHTGETLEPTANALRAKGHTVLCPTLAGNRPGEDCSSVGLHHATASLVEFLDHHDLKDVRLVGHSYGGMLVSKAADQAPQRIGRLVYANAFVPLDGECLADMTPPHYRALFESIAATNAGAVRLPYPIWRESFINDADAALARACYDRLLPQPIACFTQAVQLSQPTAALTLGRAFVNCRQDTALPHSLPWHPRLSERLGLFRYVECDGSHELLFTNPARFAAAIEEAGRD